MAEETKFTKEEMKIISEIQEKYLEIQLIFLNTQFKVIMVIG